jgi:Fe-S-cluster-containing dehydrogenase component
VKCDGCIERVRLGQVPACVDACKVDALVYGDINDLVAAGRLNDAGSILAAAAGTPTTRPGADTVGAWHAWGEAELSAGDAAQAAWSPPPSTAARREDMP